MEKLRPRPFCGGNVCLNIHDVEQGEAPGDFVNHHSHSGPNSAICPLALVEIEVTKWNRRAPSLTPAQVGEKHEYCEHVGNSCICDEYETSPCEGRPSRAPLTLTPAQQAFYDAAWALAEDIETKEKRLGITVYRGAMMKAYGTVLAEKEGGA